MQGVSMQFFSFPDYSSLTPTPPARREQRVGGCLVAIVAVTAAWATTSFDALAQTAPDASMLPPVVVTPPSQRSQARSTRPAGRPRSRPAEVASGAGATSSGQSSGAATTPGRNDLSSAAAALPAASTVITAAEIGRAPFATYGDLFRSQPGFYVADFGQGGIGYGLAMRGFTDAEHGRDIAYFIDGVPLNVVSSPHTPNYADLNLLIPETVKRIDIIRGPFSVEYGDSNLGGSVNITTKQSEPFASASLSGGSFGTIRGLGTFSREGGDVVPYLAWEGFHTEGYRDNSWIDRYNAFNKVTLPVSTDGTLSLRAQAYGTEFGSPSYISRDAVQSGALPATAAVNPADGGNRYSQSLVANYSGGERDQELRLTLYGSHDLFNRYSDFGGGQRWQQDDRTTAGGTVRKEWTGAIGGQLPVQFLVGGNWRTDLIETFQGRTFARALTLPQSSLGIEQTNIAGFAQLQIKPTDWLKLTGGTRYDQFFYDLTDHFTPTNSQTYQPGVLSPKGGISISPTSWLDLYANYGEGFRSVDAALELIGNPGIRPFKIRSREAGVQFKFERFSFLADAWTTTSENEAYQPAPGLPVTLLGRARREGFDLDARFDAMKNTDATVTVFANYGQIRATLLDSAPSFYVPNVPDYIANVGVSFDIATWNAERLSGTAFVTFVGRKYLTQDGQLATSPYSRFTGRVVYTWPDGWSAFTQATWYPGDRTSEIAINFGDVANASSADIYTSPVPELNVRMGLSYRIPVSSAMAALPKAKMVVE